MGSKVRASSTLRALRAERKDLEDEISLIDVLIRLSSLKESTKTSRKPKTK